MSKFGAGGIVSSRRRAAFAEYGERGGASSISSASGREKSCAFPADGPSDGPAIGASAIS